MIFKEQNCLATSGKTSQMDFWSSTFSTVRKINKKANNKRIAKEEDNGGLRTSEINDDNDETETNTNREI